MDHWDDRLVVLVLVPLVPLDGQLILRGSEWPHVPGNVVAPANGLDPVDSARSHPDDVTRLLDESIYRHVVRIEVIQERPPRAMEVVYFVPKCKASENQLDRDAIEGMIPDSYRSQMRCITPQYSGATPNHSQSPGPMLTLTEQKLLFSW